MQLQLQALLLFSLFRNSNGWVSTKAVVANSGSNQARRGCLLWERREPAGVETMFAKAKHMRKVQARRLARKIKPGSTLTWFLNGGERRRRHRFGTKEEEGTHGIHVPGHAGQKEVADMVTHVSLPPAWVYKSDKESRALASMKILLENEFLGLANATVMLPSGEMVSVLSHFPDVYGDVRMLRFLRKDKTGDPVSASISFRRFLRWRKDNNVDEIRAAVESQPFPVPPKLQILSELFPCNCDVNAGGPQQGSGAGVLVTLFVGKWRTAALVSLVRKEEIPLSDFLLYWTYMFESFHKQLYNESVRQSKMIFLDAVGDLHGFSLQQLSPSFVAGILRPWIKQLQANYPETARRIDVINPPKVVALLWKLVVPLLSPGTVAKIRIR